MHLMYNSVRDVVIYFPVALEMKDIWCCYDSTPSCNYQDIEVVSPKAVGNCRDGRAPRSMRIAT